MANKNTTSANSVPSKKFRITARYIFLTFPRSPSEEPINALINRILTHEKRLEPTFVRFAREAHSDGCLHHHVLLCFPKRLDTTSPSRFDYIFNDEFHANIQPARSLASSLAYLEKAQYQD